MVIDRFHAKLVPLGDGPMSDDDELAVCVHSARPMVDLERYDLSVYRIGGEFYATWFCATCGDVNETSRRDAQSEAQGDGMAAIEGHHLALHCESGK
jgi:hypothetical protein